jgi:hypothetical protein
VFCWGQKVSCAKHTALKLTLSKKPKGLKLCSLRALKKGIPEKVQDYERNAWRMKKESTPKKSLGFKEK